MPHIHEKYDFTISVFVVYRGKVLLFDHPRYGLWLPIGGHIELDETPDQALLREIEEESGLSVKILNTKPNIKSPGAEFMLTPSYLAVVEANAPHHHIDMVYFAVADSDDVKLSDEHESFRWYAEAELNQENGLTPFVIFYAQEALKAAQKVL